MIHFEPVPEPAEFDSQARQPGRQWLLTHPTGRIRDLWSPFTPNLELGFGNLCGYLAMEIPFGEIDHYLSKSEARCLAYEWSNYRYVCERMNKRKGSRSPEGIHVLDPFGVQDDWFEVELPSFHLVATDRIPPEYRERAEYTIKKLRLARDPRILRLRQAWYKRYQEGLSLEELKKAAPLIARAIEKQTRLSSHVSTKTLNGRS